MTIDNTDGKPKPVVFKYLLGPKKQDTEGGDAGCLLKKADNFPQVEFVRSAYNYKNFNSTLHSDVPALGNNRFLKKYMVTSGFLVGYSNSFEIKVFNIQQPSKDNCPLNLSNDYFQRIVIQRRVN